MAKKINYESDYARAVFDRDNEADFKELLVKNEETARWESDETGCYRRNVEFLPVYAEPLMVAAAVSSLRDGSKGYTLQSSDYAYEDTMYDVENGYSGSSQMVRIGNKVYPVGLSAISGILNLGMTKAGLDKLKEGNPEKLSQNLTNLASETDGFLTIRIRNGGKVRAFNSGRYAPCPAPDVYSIMENWKEKYFPETAFERGYFDHDITMWDMDMAAYTDTILANFPELKDAGFTPALRVVLSHNGTSSVQILPQLKMGKTPVSVGDGIRVAHRGGGTFSERVESMKENVTKSFETMFANMEDNLKRVDSLRGIQVENAYNALLRGMKSLRIPKEQAMKAAETFEIMFGSQATAFDLFMAVVDAYNYVCVDFKDDIRKQFDASVSMVGALTRIDWEKLGRIPGNFSW